jgi:hypothetical protein
MCWAQVDDATEGAGAKYFAVVSFHTAATHEFTRY